MGSLFGGGGNVQQPTPPAPVPLPPAAHPPTLASVQSSGAKQSSGAAAAEGMGFSNTVATSPQGLTQKATTAPATLLGG